MNYKIKKGDKKMRHTNEEVYNALTVLKEVCENSPDCACCPLEYDDGRKCAVGEIGIPCDWDITLPNKWKAF